MAEGIEHVVGSWTVPSSLRARIAARCFASALLAALLCALTCAAIAPGAAQAHGPTAPVATSYLARVDHAPAGVQAKVIDGYLRMWMRVSPTRTVVVLDYRGAPYLRFAPSGVYVNERSEMYYLNHVLPAELPPANLTRQTPPRWQRISDGHEYGWHDARIGALADTAIPPGTSYVGRWQIALSIGGRLSYVSGGLWHSPPPSLAWLWMIGVLIACTLAAWRLNRPELHARLARALAAALLIAIAIGIVGRELHGRPYVSAEQLAIAIPTLAFAAAGTYMVLTRRAGWIFDLITAFVAVWVGSELWPTLLHGFALTAIPPPLARATAVVCLGGGIGLLLLVMRVAHHAAQRSRTPAKPLRVLLWTVLGTMLGAVVLLTAGCGGSESSDASGGSGIPATLLAQARPIGRGPRFHPPAGGPIPGPCAPALGARVEAHVEVFAANRVVIVPAGIGVGAPWRTAVGHVSAARCYGALVTLEPTGVVLVRPGQTATLTDLFRAWGQPLTRDRVASFTALGDAGEVVVFVNGHRRHGAPGDTPLSPHAEIVVEIGQRVPPHTSYAFPAGP